jgi:XTP/dITP diphosphohydrolase
VAETDAPILLLATQNQKKRRELQEIVEGRFRVETLDALGLEDMEIIEDAETFAGNAKIKVEAIFDALGGDLESRNIAAILADDSGLCVDALDGAPGVRSARFAADHEAGEGDDDNNSLLLAKLADTPDGERGGRFCCAICVKLPGGETLDAFGTVEGDIGRALTGAGGFGYDPLFWPRERPGVTTAQLAPEEKHAISHRGRAVREALTKLDEVLG